MRMMSLAMVALLCSPVALAADRYVSVQGKAEQAVTPDEIRVNVAFSAEGKDAKALTKQVEDQARGFLADLNNIGIEKRHVQGHRFEVHPRYNKGQVDGLRVMQRYAITIEGFTAYPQVLKAAVAAGASNIGQGQLHYSKEDELYLELLAKALVNARAKARLLAKAGDARLGQVISVDEQGQHRPPVIYMRAAAADARGGAPVQSAGEITISASVSARFSLN